MEIACDFSENWKPAICSWTIIFIWLKLILIFGGSTAQNKPRHIKEFMTESLKGLAGSRKLTDPNNQAHNPMKSFAYNIEEKTFQTSGFGLAVDHPAHHHRVILDCNEFMNVLYLMVLYGRPGNARR